MSNIFGILNISDANRSFVNVVGQNVIYDAIVQMLEEYNADMAGVMAMFVERETEEFKVRYQLPGGGRLQRVGPHAAPGAVKSAGYWETAFPLETFGAGFGGSRSEVAKMTMQELDRKLDTIMTQDAATLRWEILHALFDNVNATFADPEHDSLTIRRLANGDGVTYPPVIGSETEAEEDHYLESGYLVSAVDATHNPLATIRADLVHHFGGASTGGDEIVCLMGDVALIAKLEAIAGYSPVVDRFVKPGEDTAVPINFPPSFPGRLVGRLSGCWIVEWSWIPDTYILGTHLGAPAPLQMRVEQSATGLPRGLALVATDESYPIQMSYYENRFGVGCANRLNGVAMEVANGGSYTIPTAYD